VVRLDGPSIHPSMLWPLLLMALGFTAYFVVVVILRLRAEIAARKSRALRLGQARG
jgi:heme exporter protein C